MKGSDVTYLEQIHQHALGMLEDAAGRPVTLAQALLACCDAWHVREEAERWRRVIAVEDYACTREHIAETREMLK
jgi:predicted transposase YbfD/YdcC